ncbi:MAG: site-2 protease family protein [Clostridia bacterium]|nr:site-2 protease family protein [Clostridia bacterium]
MKVTTILFAVLMFGVLVTIHEFGHYLFARIFKVTIEEFSIGMGPKILSKKSKKTGILYSLRLLPLGGYVQMVGEDGVVEDENALNKKAPWKRLIILAAGAVFNILVGVILCAVFVFMTTDALGSTQIAKFTENATTSHYLKQYDIIKEVNGHKVYTASELSFRVMWEAKEAENAKVRDENGEWITLEGVALVDFKIERDGDILVLRDVPVTMSATEGVGIGQQDFYVYAEKATFGSVTRHIFGEVRTNTVQVWASLGALLTGRVGIQHMSGPVGITEQMTQVASHGFEYLIYFAALIAINLGIFNLLPVPALDGGRLVFLIIEMIRGKPLNPELENKIHGIAMMLLLGLSFFILVKDIFGIFF